MPVELPLEPLLDGRTKGFPAAAEPLRLGQLGKHGLDVMAEDLPLPLAALKETALRHNSSWMRAFQEMTGVILAPHGKTSMSPQLFRRQLDDGAWGITVATVQQLRVCRATGVTRVLMANELVGRQAIAYVLDELARDPTFEFYALADSVAAVDALAAAAAARRPGRPLDLLVECGVMGGRTGCRSLSAALAVVLHQGGRAPSASRRCGGLRRLRAGINARAAGAADHRVRQVHRRGRRSLRRREPLQCGPPCSLPPGGPRTSTW